MAYRTSVYPAIITPPSGPRIKKAVGQAIGAVVKFKHKGQGGIAQVSWGVAPGSGTVYNYNEQLLAWIVTRREISLTDDAVEKEYTLSLSGSFPQLDPVWEIGLAGYGYYNGFDCTVSVEYEGTLRLREWWDDVYIRSDFAEPVGAAEFRDLTAIFS